MLCIRSISLRARSFTVSGIPAASIFSRRLCRSAPSSSSPSSLRMAFSCSRRIWSRWSLPIVLCTSFWILALSSRISTCLLRNKARSRSRSSTFGVSSMCCFCSSVWSGAAETRSARYTGSSVFDTVAATSGATAAPDSTYFSYRLLTERMCASISRPSPTWSATISISTSMKGLNCVKRAMRARCAPATSICTPAGVCRMPLISAMVPMA